MPNRSQEVDRFMESLNHPLKEGVEQLRAAILESNDQITEHIKWNAPSFCYAGEDRVTFRLYPEDRVQLVFHRGAKVKSDAGDFEFDDDTGLGGSYRKDGAPPRLYTYSLDCRQGVFPETTDSPGPNGQASP